MAAAAVFAAASLQQATAESRAPSEPGSSVRSAEAGAQALNGLLVLLDERALGMRMNEELAEFAKTVSNDINDRPLGYLVRLRIWRTDDGRVYIPQNVLLQPIGPGLVQSDALATHIVRGSPVTWQFSDPRGLKQEVSYAWITARKGAVSISMTSGALGEGLERTAMSEAERRRRMPFQQPGEREAFTQALANSTDWAQASSTYGAMVRDEQQRARFDALSREFIEARAAFGRALAAYNEAVEAIRAQREREALIRGALVIVSAGLDGMENQMLRGDLQRQGEALGRGIASTQDRLSGLADVVNQRGRQIERIDRSMRDIHRQERLPTPPGDMFQHPPVPLRLP